MCILPHGRSQTGVLGGKAYVRLCVLDDVLMHKVVEKGEIYFIGRVVTKNWIMLCELLQ